MNECMEELIDIYMKEKNKKCKPHESLLRLIMVLSIVTLLIVQSDLPIHAQTNTPANRDSLVDRINSLFREPPLIVELEIESNEAFGALIVIENRAIQEGEGKPFVGKFIDNQWFVFFSEDEGFVQAIQDLPDSLIPEDVKQSFIDQSPVNQPELDSNQIMTVSGYKLPWSCGKTHYVRQDWDSHPINSTNVALDIDMPLNTVITAAVGGTVFRVKEDSSVCGCSWSNRPYGNYITILNHLGLYDTYVHIAKGGAIPEVGQQVVQGQPIAYSYNTGYTCGSRAVCDSGTCVGSNCNVYNHLHFQVEQSIGGARLRPVFDDVGEVNIGYYTSGNCGETTPPVTSIELSGSVGENGWYVGPVSVNLLATDDYSGVQYSEYNINGSEWTRFSTTFVINQKGSNVINYRSMDYQGNLEIYKQANVFVDSLSPTNPTEIDPGCNATSGVWQRTCPDANFSWSGASDETSGLASYQYYWGTDPEGSVGIDTNDSHYDPPPVTEGAYYLRLRTRDVAGNWSKWQTMYILQYDTSSPSGSVVIQNDQGVTDQALVRLDTVASDDTSGVYQMRLRDEGGSWSEWQAYATGVEWILPPRTAKEHKVEVQYRDRAGNESAIKADTIYLDIYPDHPSSENYILYKSTFGMSGTNATSRHYGLVGTLGQVSATGNSGSTGYRMTSGYWSWIDELLVWIRNYLPVIEK